MAQPELKIAASLLVNIGDVVMMTAALDLIKRQRPGCRLGVIVRPEAQALLDGHPAVDELMVYAYRSGSIGSGLAELRWRLKAGGYNFFLSLDRRPRSAAAAYLAGLSPRVGPNLLFAGSKPELWTKVLFSRLVHMGPQELGGCLVERFQLVARRALNIDGCGHISLAPLTPERQAKAAALLAESQRPRVAFCVKTNDPSKTWPAEGFAALMGRLWRDFGAFIYVIGAPEDRNYIDRLAALAAPVELKNLAGATELMDIPALMAQTDLAITLDNGAAHLMAAGGVKRLICILTCPMMEEKLKGSLRQAEFKSFLSPAKDRAELLAQADEVWASASRLLGEL